jgi:predicted transcriptional regulator
MKLTAEEEIILLKKIDIAQQQIANGEFLTEEEMDAEIDSWE